MDNKTSEALAVLELRSFQTQRNMILYSFICFIYFFFLRATLDWMKAFQLSECRPHPVTAPERVM